MHIPLLFQFCPPPPPLHPPGRPGNRQTLKDGSSAILSGFDPTHLNIIRFSTVTSLNGDMDIIPFKRALMGFTIGMTPAK